MDDATRDSVNTVALSAGAAAAGVMALCLELGRAGVLSSEAVARIRETILADIELGNQQLGTSSGPGIAREIGRSFDKVEALISAARS